MSLQVYTVEVHKGYDRKCNPSCTTSGQICAYQNRVRHKGVLNGMLFSTNFSSLYSHTSTDFEDIFHKSCNLVLIVSFGIYCSVLEWGRGLVGWGGLVSNLNSVRLRFTAALWKKGYSCYISFFTNFALIYWTCLIGFGGESHRSCNLEHTVRDLD